VFAARMSPVVALSVNFRMPARLVAMGVEADMRNRIQPPQAGLMSYAQELRLRCCHLDLAKLAHLV